MRKNELSSYCNNVKHVGNLVYLNDLVVKVNQALILSLSSTLLRKEAPIPKPPLTAVCKKLAFEQLRFDEKERIIELLQQRKTRWQSRLSGSGILGNFSNKLTQPVQCT
jgi:hypothetical protein